MSDIYSISGRIYPAKSGRLELIDVLNEQIHAAYQPTDRASITRPVLERVVADLEHAVQLLDALQDERDKRIKADEEIERLRGLLYRCQVAWVEDGSDLAAEVRAALEGKTCSQS